MKVADDLLINDDDEENQKHVHHWPGMKLGLPLLHKELMVLSSGGTESFSDSASLQSITRKAKAKAKAKAILIA